MSELINFFPTLLLGAMVALTLILLPLLTDDRPAREERQRTDRHRFQLEPTSTMNDVRTLNPNDDR